MDSRRQEKTKKFRSVYRPKRKFRGNQHTRRNCHVTLMEDVVAESTTVPRPTHAEHVSQAATPTGPANTPEIRSVSSKKILLKKSKSMSPLKKDRYHCKPAGFRFTDMEIFGSVFSFLACPECFQLCISLKEINRKRYGCASFLKLVCDNCHWEYVFYTSKKAGRAFEVNRRIVYAMRAIGKGRSSAAKFCGLMNLPPPPRSNAYKSLEIALNIAVKTVANETMAEAASEIHSAVGHNDVIETGISADGTWQKRGYSSLHGVSTAISMDTGKVLDTEILTQYCKACALHEKDDKDTIAYQVWKAEHAIKCKANFKGSSGSMEPAGIEKMYKRSIDKHGLLYTSLYCDGDSKSHDRVKNLYKEKYSKEVKRLQCVGHVQKRLGTALRKLKKDVKGLGGKGKLTKALIDKLQNYYGIAIRANVGDLKGMKQAIDASFFHCIATANSPHMHVHCPDGKDSWCRFKQDKAANTNTYKPSKGLPMSVIKEVKPVYVRLSQDSLLEQCLHGKTQNQNESLNAMIWDRAPKETFAGSSTVETAAYDAIAHFNTGAEASVRILKELGIEVGEHTKDACKKLDFRRISISEYKEEMKVKQRRKQIRGKKKRKIDEVEQREGMQYGAGEFAV